MAIFIGFAVHGLWIERSGGGFDIHCINGIKNLSFFQRRDHPIKTLGAGVLRMLRQLYKLVRLAMRGSLPLLALSLFIVPLNEGKGSEKDYEASDPLLGLRTDKGLSLRFGLTKVLNLCWNADMGVTFSNNKSSIGLYERSNEGLAVKFNYLCTE